MVNCCVCFGCNNSNLSGHRVHRFPNKKDRHFRAWIRFVQAKRSNFAASSVTRHTVMCEKHFTPESYNQGDLMESRLGFRRREWVRLANGAVPSVHAGLPATSGGSESSTSRESARRKRELCTILGESAASNDAAGATTTSEPEDGDGDTSTMDPEPVVVHRGSQCNIRCFHRSLEDCDDFGDRSTQCDATSESLYAPGSSHMSSHSEELRILNVYGKGEGPLALDGHDTLVSELEALNSLSADHSVVKSLERGEQLVRREELTGQQTTDTILIKVEEDMDGAMPTVEDCDDFGDCSTQHSAALDSLHVDAPGSSHMSSHNRELRILNVYGKGEGPLAVDGNDTLFTASEREALISLSADNSVVKSLERGEQLVHREELTVQQTPDTISIKEEEDIDGGMHAGEDCDDFGDCSTQHSAALDSLHVDAPGSSHMSSHNGELRILNIYGKGEGPLAVDGHDTLFTSCKLEAQDSLSADHSVVKSLESGEQLVHREELTGHRGGGKGRPGVLSGEGFTNMSTRSGEKPYGCDQCKKRFQHKGILKTHMRTHSREKPYRCDQCVKRFSLSFNLKVHMRTHSGEKPYKCNQCVKRFGHSASLKSHMRTHSGEKPYRCNQCVKRFSKSYNLKIHMRIHSGEKPHKCNQCMKCFSKSYNLKIHMRTHSGEKPNKCNQCMKCFSHSSDLKVHIRTHSGEKPYRCDQCVKRFSHSTDLKIHMRTHSREKPYRCDQCVKRFSHSTDLKSHMRTHSGVKSYGCDQCVKRFGQSSHLKSHMRIHSGEKPYRCDQCVMCFIQSSGLKRHMRIHSGEKPYRCDQCVKRFNQCSALKRHKRSCSGEGLGMSSDAEEDPIDRVSEKHVVLTQAEQAEEEDSPALQDVFMTHRHLHLPGIEEVEALAGLLLKLADDSDLLLVPANLRQKITAAANALHDHDKTAARFVKRYESRWGFTLFDRCLGADSPETRAAQKTKFGWMRYAQAAQVTEESRLLYLLLKMLKHRAPANQLTSPSKVTTYLKGQYKIIADRVRDDPILGGLAIPLPNINAKSISTFTAREEKKANYGATVLPKVTPHLKVLSDAPFPEAPALPTSLPPPDRPQVQYRHIHHEAGKRRGEKRRLFVDEPEPVTTANRPVQPTGLSSSTRPKPPAPTHLQPRPPAALTYDPPPVSAAPILLVLHAQPQAPSVLFRGPSCSQSFVPPAPTVEAFMPNKSLRPCGACHVPNCGGQRKRYTPSKDKVAGSIQKMFSYCPSTRMSTTPRFDNVAYDNFEHFKSVVDAELERRTV